MNAALPRSCLHLSPRLRRPTTAILSRVIMSALISIATPAARAQTYTVIHYFTGGGDGANPYSGLTMQAEGNFYGTACYGGPGSGRFGSGLVFRLKRSGSGWVLTPIYSFAGGNDGMCPQGRVAIAPDGTLYGTTAYGGGNGCPGAGHTGCGTVFHLTPSAAAPKSALAPWKETIVYRFSGGDGQWPGGDLTFDQSGSIYGTTIEGGSNGNGVIYELSPSGDMWTEAVLYSAQNYLDGLGPIGGVVFDKLGNLYGAFNGGGAYDDGAVYELSPSGSGWTEQLLYTFSPYPYSGQSPNGGLTIDSSGNLYGTNFIGGPAGGGTVFELAPSPGGWTYNVLYGFPTNHGDPANNLTMDAQDNLYGTTFAGGSNEHGSVYRLTPSGGGWMFTDLYDFTDGTDGGYPLSNIVFDASGRLYGTAVSGGMSCQIAGGCGVVFEITP